MTLEQDRAAKAFADVSAVASAHGKSTPQSKSYGSFALKLPVLVRTAGLCQALHFLDSRGKETATLLLQHLAAQLTRVDPDIATRGLLDRVRQADLPTYLRLSRETVAIATWYARLAQSVLDVRPGEEAGEP